MEKKFGVRDQVGYFFGDFAGSLVNIYIDSYFLVFCTYVLGISPFFMGTLFFCAKIWDAVTAPIIGSLPDYYKLGRGTDKFKPWVKAAMIPLALSGVLSFLDVSSWPVLWRNIWVAVVYILFGTAYTGTSMPYGAMSSVITADGSERSKLSRARSIGGLSVNTFVMGMIPKFIYDSSGSYVASGFLKTMLVCAAGSIVSYMLLVTLTTERVKAEQKERLRYSEVVKGVLHNRPLIGIMLASVGLMFYYVGNGQLMNLVFKEYYQQPELVSLAFACNMPLMLILFPLIPRMTKRFGKKRVVMFGYSYCILISLFLCLVPIGNPYIFLLGVVVRNSGLLTFDMLVWAMVTDCIDYQKAKTGACSEGSVYSIYTLSRKVGSAVAGAAISFLLGAVGFVSGQAAQSAEVAGWIRIMFVLCPAVGAVLGCVGVGAVYGGAESIKEG